MHNFPRDSSRLRHGLNPLLTTPLAISNNFPNQAGTPISAVSSQHYSTNQTPSSAIQPYNPQEWVASPAVGPDRTHQFSAASSELTPPPPPPYSPPRSSRPISQIYETPTANTSVPRAPPTSTHRPSPDPPSNAPNPVFPPPPGTNSRGGSRERRFLPSLRRKTQDTDMSTPSVTTPEPYPPASLSRPVGPSLSIQIPQDANAVPPSSRRAVSTPAMGTPTSARSRSSSQVRWEPGMPVPPPPPGPPPSQSRSQSSSRAMEMPTMVAPPTRRPPLGSISNLGSVPPTPAGWVDSPRRTLQQQPQQSSRGPSPHQGLSVDTSSVSSSNQSHEHITSSASSTPSAGGLTRTMALRGEKTLRQRRAESKSYHVSQCSIDGALDGKLSNIVIPGDLMSRTSRGTPRNAASEEQNDSQLQETTPRAAPHPETPTPPFSPRPQKRYSVEPSPSIAPKALPTPPPQNRSRSQTRHSALRRDSTDSPFSPRVMMKQLVVSQTPEQFCQATIERFQAFADREMTATSDAERVRMFAEFIVSESRLRRERYNKAIATLGHEIFDLTRDLFRPLITRRDSAAAAQSGENTPLIPHSGRSLDGMPGPSGNNSAPPSTNIVESPMSTPSTGSITNGGGQWGQAGYMPSLSPILSMSVSDHNGETSSRGRPASRWWETDSSGQGSQRLERSKRESKYMGVPREAWVQEEELGNPYRNSSAEYPPEKVGWHETTSSTASDATSAMTPQPLRPLSTSSAGQLSGQTTPNTATNTNALDVSRLVTLPPPYPRHHPAVNNSHPNLTSIRTKVRTLSDFSETNVINERFIESSKKARAEAAESAQKRKTTLRANLQAEITAGRMSYAEAASIESDSSTAEANAAKDLEKKDFDAFQREVVIPVNNLLSSRIASASELFDTLRSRLFEENVSSRDPTAPQEEGDETPELLEKLTLLKWIFESRESLHKAIYDMLSDRNDRYKNVIITPYKLSGNEDKLRSAEAFFAEDAQKRALAFLEEQLKRTQEFRDVVEENVVRGVEVQLSAFWDIAPPLKGLLDKIPSDDDPLNPLGLSRFIIQIPQDEYAENPSYHNHPLQYLFSLLLHAEKSTYQFIESQTNLLCLLHEVKEAVLSAKAKVMQQEGREPGRIAETTRDDERRLDEDLKEKVRVVQDQWKQALGEAFVQTKARLGEFLLSTGGWDESLEEGGVGTQ